MSSDTLPAEPALTAAPTPEPKGSFESFYARFYPRLVSHIRGRTRDLATAEDVAQETLIRAFTRFEKLEAQGIWSWMKVVATHLIVDHTRKRVREVPLDGLERVGILDGIGRAEDRLDLADALSRLSPRQRMAVKLRYLDDLDPSEVAAFLRLNGSAFKQLLYRGRRNLRTEYRRLSEGVGVVALAPLLWLRRSARAAGRGLRGATARARVLVSPGSPVLQLSTVLVFLFTFAGGSSATADAAARSGSSADVSSWTTVSRVHHSVVTASFVFSNGQVVTTGDAQRAARGASEKRSRWWTTGCVPVDRAAAAIGRRAARSHSRGVRQLASTTRAQGSALLAARSAADDGAGAAPGVGPVLGEALKLCSKAGNFVLLPASSLTPIIRALAGSHAVRRSRLRQAAGRLVASSRRAIGGLVQVPALPAVTEGHPDLPSPDLPGEETKPGPEHGEKPDHHGKPHHHRHH